MDIDQDIREHVLANLPFDDSNRPELEAKSAADLLIIFLNWFLRLVPATLRRVHRSQALQHNPLTTAYKSDLDALVGKISTGQDLTPHLSTRVRSGYASPTTGSYTKRADLDLMLAEWHVHHLHLSSKLRADGFVERTEPLLFAAFTWSDAFLIDLFRHGDWTKEAIAHILINEWPQSGFVHEAKGVLGLERHVSERDRAALRAGGVSSPFIQHNGRFYMIGLGGITSAGTSGAATRQAAYVLRAAIAFSEYAATNPDSIIATLRASGFEAPEFLDLHLTFVADGSFCILERTTGARFRL